MIRISSKQYLFLKKTMNKLWIMIMLLFFVNISNAQHVLGFGITVKTNLSNSRDTVETSNYQYRTYTYTENYPILFCRYDLNSNFGLKIGITRRGSSYNTYLPVMSGVKAVGWSTTGIYVPIGFYLKTTPVVGKFYMIFNCDAMLITKKNKTFDYTSLEKYKDEEIPFYSQQKRDWGAVLTFLHGFGYTISKRSRVEMVLGVESQFYGHSQIDNTYYVSNKDYSTDIVTDKISKKSKNIDLNYYFAASYVYMFVKKEKKTSSN